MVIFDWRVMVWVALMAGCSPQKTEVPCPIDSGDFAFRSIAGGPIRKPREARVGADEPAPGDDHGDAHEPTEGPWLPGEPEFGAVTVRDRTDPERAVVHRDAWRPARTPTLDAWTSTMRPPMDDAVARQWLNSATCAELAPKDDPILWWRVRSGEWLDDRAWMTRCRETGLADMAVDRCVDETCVLSDKTGGLVVLRQGEGDNRFALVGVAEGWRGDGAAIKAFSRALGAARVAPYESELGEVLSIEEAGRLSDVETRLLALAKAHPDHYFLTYFVARNRAGQMNYAGAMALLEALAADPAPEAIAARAMTGLHEEWTHLRANPRYQTVQAELHRRIPDDAQQALAWLLRFRRSIPHMNAASLNGGPGWMELREVVRIAALYPVRWSGLVAEISTPAGTHLIEFDHDSHSIAGVRRVVLAEPKGTP